MARIIALVNQKGGVGKTTSAINIGAGLHKAGKRVLLVDLDSQGNLTLSVGIQAHELERTTFELLKGGCIAAETIIDRGYHVIPSDIRLSAADLEFSGIPGREMLLKEALEPIVKQYDYILIDCPPSLGLMALNGLAAAEEVFVPLQAHFLALSGMVQLLQTVNVVKKRINPQLEITGVIITMFDSRKNLNKEVLERIQEYFPHKVFRSIIRDNISLAEAPSFGQDIFTYKADSRGATDYMSLCKEINMQRGMKK